jgi:DNA polymerase/3'-5' exonuclease PolX
MNANIITQFEKLIEQIKSDIDHSLRPEDKVKHSFRLKQVKNALSIIKKYPNEIKAGKDIESLKGIGKGTVMRIDEILNTGKLSEIKISMKYEESLKAMEELERIFGIGRVTAHDLVVNQHITSIKMLKEKHESGKIELPHQIVLGLKYYGVFEENIPRREIDDINIFLQKVAKSVNKDLIMTISGSYRRGNPTSGDIDVLLSHKTKNYTIKFVEKLKKVGFIIDDLTDKDYNVKYMGFSKYLNNPVRRLDIKFVLLESYHAALLHFTGPWNFNQQIRELAKHLGYLLNEYGLFKLEGSKKIKMSIKSEKDIFDALGLEYIEPNKRS